MRFTDIFIRRRILSVVVSILILAIGLRAVLLLPVRQFPLLTSATVTIRTSYPGAPPELMQGFITTPIERAVGSIEGIDYMTSSSTQGVSQITVTLRLNYDPAIALTDVMSKVQQVKSQLPQESNDPIITRSGGAENSMFLAFRSKELTGPEMADLLIRTVQPLVSTVEGVASTQVNGAGALAMRIWLQPNHMAARGVTAEDIATAIRANNVQSAPGQTKGYFVVQNVVTNTGLKDADAFREMVIKTVDGAPIKIGDVAEVELAAENSDSMAFHQGENGLIMAVAPLPDANPITISQGVKEKLPEIRRALPPSMQVYIGSDNSEFIEQAIEEVAVTLAEGIVVVVIVIFLFLGSARSMIIPVVTIPLSIVGVAIFMMPLGFSINLLTLLAMVLATGLVVDDAIVVVENIHRHIEEGRTPLDAALIGAREIVGPIISMALTLAAVYAPIGFLGGLTGALFKEFAFTLAGAMVISGVVALTLSPMMCSVLLRGKTGEGRFEKFTNRVLAGLADRYSRALSVALDYRPAIGVAAIGVLAAGVMMFGDIKTELAPPEDQNNLRTQVRGPQYVNADYMKQYVLQIDKMISEIPESATRFVIVGQGNTPNNAFANGRFGDWRQRKRSTLEIMPELQRKIARLDGVTGFVFSPPSLPAVTNGPPVQMVITTTGGYEELYAAVERLQTASRESRLFGATDSSLNFNSPVVNLDIDRAKAADLGISMDSIARTLATLVGENYVNRFILQGRAYQVIPQVPRELRLSAESLRQFYIRTKSGALVPLSTIVTTRSTVQPNALTRFNQMNSATFSANPVSGVSMGEAVAFLTNEAANLPSGFTTEWLADSRQYVQEGNQLLITFGFSLLIIYLVLAAQFESIRDPLVILVSVPMSVCGALIPLFFGMTTLNIYTQIGLVTLIGLISKHGILMVAFARDAQIRDGADRRTAIEAAARVRLRPILMTTAAMIAGLMPLVFATGAGAASRFAMGVVVVFGMAIGTLFTLFVLPAVYTWIASDRSSTVKNLRAQEAALAST